MKKSLAFFSIALSISLVSCAQKNIPVSVQEGFQKNFPKAQAKWDKEGVNYEANFTQDKSEMSAVFDSNGMLLETETAMEATALPAAITSYVTAHYKGASVKEAAKIVKANGEINFEAAVKGKDLLFDSNGNFLRIAED